MVLGFFWQEVLLLCHGGELCAFTLALLLPLLGQRLGQEPERYTGQHDYGASHYEAQPPGTHPAGVLIVDGDTVWERSKDLRLGSGLCLQDFHGRTEPFSSQLLRHKQEDGTIQGPLMVLVHAVNIELIPL